MTGDLSVEGIEVRFGGALAVQDLSLVAPAGRITGLIGPNGAGKTTTFNVCSGLITPSAGRVHLDGEDVTELPPAARARRGLGRTFQRMELFNSMTVRDNVALGCEARAAGRNAWRQVVPVRADRRRIDERVTEALTECGLSRVADRPVGALATGQRRLVELARVRAAGFQFLLLDEPTSGLDPAETARMAEIVTRWATDQGVGVLLIEHDMALVLGVCDHVYVLDFGILIYDGSPDEVRSSPIVEAAYLGDDDGVLEPEGAETA